jgi:hypothetical protein
MERLVQMAKPQRVCGVCVCYAAGFYSSRPTLKGMIRQAAAVLQVKGGGEGVLRTPQLLSFEVAMQLVPQPF